MDTPLFEEVWHEATRFTQSIYVNLETGSRIQLCRVRLIDTRVYCRQARVCKTSGNENYFGWQVNYAELVNNGTIETLKSRRTDAVLKFAIKTASSEQFGKTWYKLNNEIKREVRPSTRNHFIEKRCRVERGRSNPLSVMTRRLNEHYRANTETN